MSRVAASWPIDMEEANGSPGDCRILAKSLDPDAVSTALTTLNVGGACEEHARCPRWRRLVGETDLLQPVFLQLAV
jgi:hypothetical protein